MAEVEVLRWRIVVELVEVRNYDSTMNRVNARDHLIVESIVFADRIHRRFEMYLIFDCSFVIFLGKDAKNK